MKKSIKIIANFFLLTFIILSLLSCGKKGYDTDETKAFKEVLELIEQNRGKSNKKGYEIKFEQDFIYEEKEESAKIETNYKAHYISSGTVLLSYEAANASDVNIENNFESFINNATGFISGVQSERHEIINEETDVDTKQIVRKENFNYGVDNKFIYDTNSNNVSVMSETSYLNYDQSKTTKDSFYGKIAKSTLLDIVEISKINEAINNLMFIDVWDSINLLLKLLHNKLINFDTNNYENIYNYLENKDFKYERKDNSIIIEFKISIDENYTDAQNDFDDVKIKLEVDTKTKEILNFKFDLSNYLASILKTEDTESNEFKSNVNSYFIEGKILNNTLAKMDTSNIIYKEYNEETKYDFVDDFNNHAFPIREDVYEY